MRTMTSRRYAAFTWVELLVTLFIITVLVLLALPAITTTSHHRSPGTQTFSNMKQLHLATQSMALDGTTTENTNLAWPGSTGGTFATWAKNLVPSYLSSNDFCKLLSAPEFAVDPRKFPFRNENAILVYGVTEDQDGSYTFLTTANFTNSPTGGNPLQADAKPYGNKGFLVFRKGGDGAILLPNQTRNTNLIGSYAPLLR